MSDLDRPLRKWRLAHGLTAKRAAAKINVSRGAWHRYEAGTRVPDGAVLRRILALTNDYAIVISLLDDDTAFVMRQLFLTNKESRAQ